MNRCFWQLQPCSQYEVPHLPVRGMAAQAWGRFVNTFVKGGQNSEPFRRDDTLKSLSEARMQALFQPMVWSLAAEAMLPFLERGMGKRMPCIVFQPFQGQLAVMQALAQHLDALIIEPPSIDDILSGGDNWIDGFDKLLHSGKAWLIADLGLYFVRHANGLNLLRNLVLRLGQHPNHGVIGCNSWSLAYIQRVLGHLPFQGLAWSAADANALEQGIATLLKPRASMAASFRDASNGDDVLPSIDESGSAENASKKPAPHPLFSHLSADCRGNFPLSVAHWKARLRDEPDEDADIDVEAESGAGGKQRRHRCVWVSASLPEPNIPSEKQDNWLTMLHSVLLHGGLAEQRLQVATSVANREKDGVMAELLDAGFLSCEEGHFYVNAMAYPSIRRALHARSFLVDPF